MYFFVPGTTWTSEIGYLILHDVNLAKVNSEPTEKRIPFIEIPAIGIHGIRDLPEPRLIKTHLPYEELPKSFIENKTKVFGKRNLGGNTINTIIYQNLLNFF